jgi:predicted RNA-binding Zn-ribbon protein involved in translation (DUF1610 family)
MPEAVCVKCEVALRPETNGVSVAEMMKGDTEIYRIRDADLWKCPGCGLLVILGFASHGYEHWEVGFHPARICHAMKRNEGKAYTWNERLRKEEHDADPSEDLKEDHDDGHR